MPTPKLTQIRANSPGLRTRQSSCWKSLGIYILNTAVFIFFADAGFRVYRDTQREANPDSALKMISKTKLDASSSSSSIIYNKVKEGEISGYAKEASLKYEIFSAIDKTTNNTVTVKEWAHRMAHGSDALALAKEITKVITDTPYPGVFFETKGVTSKNANQKTFEFTIIDGEHLANFAEPHADPEAFRQHLACSDNEYACQFFNLGGDAILVSPKKTNPTKEDKVYSHLAAFLQGAPEEQVLQVWQKVAAVYDEILQTRESNKPVWFSTAGEGVFWLHFRFDDKPKYYHYFNFAREQ